MSLTRRLLPLLLALICGPLGFAADEMEEMVKKTDMNSADSVYALGVWCEENNKPTAARKWFNKAIQLDKNHEASRTKLGQVLVGDRWVPANMVPGGAKKPEGKGEDAGPRRRSSGPGPTAKDVKWDLTLEEPERENQFIETQIKRMNDNKNDSDAMDSAVLTLYREDSRKEMVPRLCAALMRDSFTDLYGPAMLIMEFAKAGDLSTVKRLTGFLARASERNTDRNDLETFAYIAPLARDRRVIPRLIELMEHPDEAVQFSAKRAFGQVSLQPSEGLTAAKAKAWWDLNHDVSERVFLNEQLQSSDPMVAVEAAKGLYDLREKAIVPVLIKTLKGDDRKANEKAVDLIRRITGNDWGYDVMAAPDARLKIVAQLEKWWKENGTRFEWIEDRNAKPAADGTVKQQDPFMEWVRQLASTTGNDAQLAEQNLLGKGDEAVPTLIKGLKDPGVIVRRKCNDILKALSKKDVGFDPRGEEDQRLKGIAAWTAWAKEKGLIKDAEAAQ
jgi:hypothetical protein